MRVARVAGAEKEAKIREEKIVEKSPSFKDPSYRKGGNVKRITFLLQRELCIARSQVCFFEFPLYGIGGKKRRKGTKKLVNAKK